MKTFAWMPGWLRHAPVYAIALGAVAFAAGLVIATQLRKRAAARRVREALAREAVAPAAWQDGARAWIRGTLRGAPVASVTVLGFGARRELQEHGPRAAPDEAAVEVDGVDPPVRLDGSVAVLAGTHVVRHFAVPHDHFEIAMVARDRARRAGQLGMWPAGIDGYHVRRAVPGDAVLAGGTLARGDDGAWTLRPAGAAIEVAALGAEIDPAPLPPLGTMARSALLGVAVWLVVAYVAHL